MADSAQQATPEDAAQEAVAQVEQPHGRHTWSDPDSPPEHHQHRLAWVDLRDYGNDLAAATEELRRQGGGTLYVPGRPRAGYFCDGLDWRGLELNVLGDGPTSIIAVRGKPIDATGARLTIENITIGGYRHDPPAAALVFGRPCEGERFFHSRNWTRFERVSFDGYATRAQVVNYGGELFLADSCSFHNRQAGGHGLLLATTDELVGLGKQTEHAGFTLSAVTFLNCAFGVRGNTGTEASLVLDGAVHHVRLIGCWFGQTGGLAAVWLRGGPVWTGPSGGRGMVPSRILIDAAIEAATPPRFKVLATGPDCASISDPRMVTFWPEQAMNQALADGAKSAPERERYGRRLWTLERRIWPLPELEATLAGELDVDCDGAFGLGDLRAAGR